MSFVTHLGSKEGAKEMFLAVGPVQNSDKVRYAELKIYMHNRYVNCKYRWPKIMPDTPDVLVNWNEGGGSEQQCESRESVALTNKINPSGFRGDCYNFGNSGHMARNCPEPRGKKKAESPSRQEKTHRSISTYQRKTHTVMWRVFICSR